MKINISFWSYLAQFFLKWEKFQTNFADRITIQILCSLIFIENRTVYEILRKNIFEPGGPLMAIWHMRIACWISKATFVALGIHSVCVILIAFPLQQWLHEGSWMLRYAYIACLVYFFRKGNPIFFNTPTLWSRCHAIFTMRFNRF
jgi:hypothetical protein